MSELAPFFPGEFIEEEMAHRGWDVTRLAVEMSERGATLEEVQVTVLALELYLAVREPGLLLDHKMIAGLSRAFGTSQLIWKRLENQWQAHGMVTR